MDFGCRLLGKRQQRFVSSGGPPDSVLVLHVTGAALHVSGVLSSEQLRQDCSLRADEHKVADLPISPPSLRFFPVL